eukprot:TRINITY_DN27303_c0_g1_i1.p1 TRINITY_DN27303_c0_g1~~TRINITY_DN27303_c0_g1_i1.p1  ORF type:complete len:842 (+),score=182.23 TRINITY_DN27303_c0_g1_i1:333-2528(+)
MELRKQILFHNEAASFAEGDAVRLVNIAGRPDLHMASGTIVQYDSAVDRWRVLMDDGSGKLIKTENLLAVDSESPPVSPASPEIMLLHEVGALAGRLGNSVGSRSPAVPAVVGSPVRSQQLPAGASRAAPRAEVDNFEQQEGQQGAIRPGLAVRVVVNSGSSPHPHGTVGVAFEFQKESGKWIVTTSDGSQILCAASSLEAAGSSDALTEGCRVQVHGLTEFLALNGCLGVAVEKEQERWRVKLDNGTGKKLRAENLRKVIDRRAPAQRQEAETRRKLPPSPSQREASASLSLSPDRAASSESRTQARESPGRGPEDVAVLEGKSAQAQAVSRAQRRREKELLVQAKKEKQKEIAAKAPMEQSLSRSLHDARGMSMDGVRNKVASRIKVASVGVSGQVSDRVFRAADHGGLGRLDQQTLLNVFRTKLRLPPDELSDEQFAALCEDLCPDSKGRIQISALMDLAQHMSARRVSDGQAAQQHLQQTPDQRPSDSRRRSSSGSTPRERQRPSRDSRSPLEAQRRSKSGSRSPCASSRGGVAGLASSFSPASTTASTAAPPAPATPTPSPKGASKAAAARMSASSGSEQAQNRSAASRSRGGSRPAEVSSLRMSGIQSSAEAETPPTRTAGQHNQYQPRHSSGSDSNAATPHDAANRSRDEAAASAEPLPGGIQPGATAVVHGLKSQVELNGTAVSVMEWKAEKERWRVTLSDGKTIKLLKECNLTPAPAAPSQI